MSAKVLGNEAVECCEEKKNSRTSSCHRSDEVQANDNDSDEKKLELVSKFADCGPSGSRTMRRFVWNRTNEIRVLYFVFYCSSSCIAPFVNLYLRTESKGGIDSQTLGMLTAIKPIVTIVAAPFWGSVATYWTANQQQQQQQGLSGVCRVLLLTYVVSNASRLILPFALDNMCILFLSKFVCSIFVSPVRSLLDSFAMTTLPPSERSKFGRYRIWGQFGTGISSALMMAMVNATPLGYNIMFLVHGLLTIPTVLCIISVSKLSSRDENNDNDEAITSSAVENKMDNSSMKKRTSIPNKKEDGASMNLTSAAKKKQDFIRLIHDPTFLSLLLLILICGFSLGFLETFAYVHIRQSYEAAQATQQLGQHLSLCRVCISLGGMTMYWYSSVLSKWMGQERFMLLCPFGLASCFYLYGMVNVSRPPHGPLTLGLIRMLFGEFVRGGITAAFWSTVTVYAHTISTPEMKATLLLFLVSAYRGVGCTSGSIIGTFIIRQLKGDMSRVFTYTGRMVFSLAIVVATTLATTRRNTTKEKAF